MRGLGIEDGEGAGGSRVGLRDPAFWALNRLSHCTIVYLLKLVLYGIHWHLYLFLGSRLLQVVIGGDGLRKWGLLDHWSWCWQFTAWGLRCLKLGVSDEDILRDWGLGVHQGVKEFYYFPRVALDYLE